MFEVGDGHKYFWVSYDIHNTDVKISKLLGIELEDYRDILRKFNAIKIQRKECMDMIDELYFENEKDAQKAVDYLNREFEVLLKLLE